MLSLEKDKIKVLLLEGIDQSAIGIFHENGYSNVETISTALNGPDLIDKLQDTFILGIRSRSLLTKEIMEQAPKLFAVGCYCIGTDQVQLKDAALKGIPVFNAPYANTRSVAELVMGLTIMLMRDIFSKNLAAHEGKWLKSTAGSHEVRGKVMGIIGYGHIGSQVSVLAEALGMQVIYYDILPKLPLGNAKPMDSLENLLQEADIATLHIPDNEGNRHMMNEDRFQSMKKGASFINTSRGSVVDIDALRKALDQRNLKNAAVDVFPHEPESSFFPFNSPLQGDPRVILTPHIGGATLEAQRNIGIEVSRKLAYYSDRGSTEGAVNFPVINLLQHKNTHRILHVHKNIPGMLQQINKAVADENINIQSQYLMTNPDIGYVVLDVEKKISPTLKEKLQSIKGTIRNRILY